MSSEKFFPDQEPGWAVLRKPFPKDQLEKKPQVNCWACTQVTKDAANGRLKLSARDKHCDRHVVQQCSICNNYITTGHIHLDYVGHANATNRLLEVDPTWTWEPFALDQQGLPALDRDGNLWIRLTILNVTKPGVGDGASLKEKIGDAIRNAAMRFGVALDLWAKVELQHGMSEANGQVPDPVTGEVSIPEDEVRLIDHGQLIELKKLEHELGVDGDDDRPKRLEFYKWAIRRPVSTSKDLTQAEAIEVIVQLSKRVKAQVAATADE